MRLSWYAARLQAGACDPRATQEFVVDAGGLPVIDGREAMGQIVAARAMDEVTNRARAHGIGVVAVRNPNHVGTAMSFTPRAARAGCIGFRSTDASPSTPPGVGASRLSATTRGPKQVSPSWLPVRRQKSAPRQGSKRAKRWLANASLLRPPRRARTRRASSTSPTRPWCVARSTIPSRPAPAGRGPRPRSWVARGRVLTQSKMCPTVIASRVRSRR
ncbi:Ldh family oxidoreductase [Methylobacterium sp. ap11]|uniref:Ldh family oxidoreductase n=1 Tax=Methylobacterium sp. ap11 TaxID=1761799 RepID=UPI001FCD067B|nr:Ldh family oxidoreductase [Methylobacterium sp. ap11]